MTFPCKEQFITFEKLAGRQRRIYQDAADFGIPLGDVQNLDAVRADLRALMEFYKKAFPKYYKAYNWGANKSVEMFIGIEHDGPNIAGIEFSVSFNYDNKVSGGGFISIDIRYTTKAD